MKEMENVIEEEFDLTCLEHNCCLKLREMKKKVEVLKDKVLHADIREEVDCLNIIDEVFGGDEK
jgi:hypothetical protein